MREVPAGRQPLPALREVTEDYWPIPSVVERWADGRLLIRVIAHGEDIAGMARCQKAIRTLERLRPEEVW